MPEFTVEMVDDAENGEIYTLDNGEQILVQDGALYVLVDGVAGPKLEVLDPRAVVVLETISEMVAAAGEPETEE